MRLTEEDVIKEKEQNKINADGKTTENETNKDVSEDNINIEETDIIEEGKGSLKKKVKKQKNAYAAEMSRKERIAYFWDYNKATVGVIVLLAVVTILFIRAIILELKPPIICVSMTNAHMDSAADATFGYDYGNERGLDTKKGKITMDVEYIYPQEVTDLTLTQEHITASIQKYASAVTNSYIDASIATDWVIKEFQMADVYTDLRTLYTEEEMAAFGEDRWYWAKNEAGVEIVAGIKVNGYRGIDDFYLDGQTVLIAIPDASKRKDTAKDFILWFCE